ncbi:protein-lysine N-methyltransferase EEF2KMT isoform X3 [Ptiloglossa arizonensis]
MDRDLFDTNKLTEQFLCCTPINTIDTFVSTQNTSCLIDLNEQKKILENTVNNNLNKKYPIKRSYQQAFLKLLMKKIEEEGGEIHDDIYSAYCYLISLSLNESNHFRHFLIDDKGSDYISVQESTNIISEGTTGLCSWQGALELSKWCTKNRNEFCGKVILELGCGVGLTGLCIIKKCSPKQYIFSDCHQTVLDMVSKNIKLNLLQNIEKVQIKPQLEIDRLKFQIKYNNTDVEVMELRWEDIKKYLTEHWIMPDIIIGADILYDTNSFHTLVLVLKALLSFNNRYAIIAGIIRNVDTFSQFLHLLELHDLSFEKCIVPEQTILIQ